MDTTLNPQKKRQILLAVGVIIIAAAFMGVLFDKLKSPKSTSTNPQSYVTNTPNQLADEVVSLQESTIYLGSYNNEDVLYFSNGSNSNSGTVVMKNGSSVKNVYFTSLDGVSALYTIPGNLNSITNFVFTEDKNLIFVSLVTDDARLGNYPDNLVNKIHRISMVNLTGAEVWSSNFKSNKFNANGASRIDAIGGNVYLVASILKCLSCASSD